MHALTHTWYTDMHTSIYDKYAIHMHLLCTPSPHCPLMVVMVTVWCRRQGKEGVNKDTGTNRGVRFQVTQNTIKSTAYYEPKNPNVDPAHFHHHPHLHTPYTNITSALSNTDNGDDISMQDCPAYQSIEETPTWDLGEYTYIDIWECHLEREEVSKQNNFILTWYNWQQSRENLHFSLVHAYYLHTQTYVKWCILRKKAVNTVHYFISTICIVSYTNDCLFTSTYLYSHKIYILCKVPLCIVSVGTPRTCR